MIVGVLALQGDFMQHVRILSEAAGLLGLDASIKLVKKPADLRDLSGLVIPGGESTTIGTLMRARGLDEAIAEAFTERGLRIFATCAGLILLAKDIADRVVGETDQPRLGLLDIGVIRNAFGRQRESFEAPIMLSDPFLKRVRELNERYSVRLSLEHTANGIFIRAPAVKDPRDNEVIATLADNTIVGVMNERVIGLAFHPELSDDLRFHAVFLDMVSRVRGFFGRAGENHEGPDTTQARLQARGVPRY